MNIKENINYWIDLAVYDIEAAKTMHNSGIYLQTGSLCHQAAEKLLKAYHWKALQDEPPFTDDLSELYAESFLSDKLTEECENFLNSLKPFKNRMRFPGDNPGMLSSFTKEKSSMIITGTEEFYEWILQLITDDLK